jgi:hypothetical protein
MYYPNMIKILLAYSPIMYKDLRIRQTKIALLTMADDFKGTLFRNNRMWDHILALVIFKKYLLAYTENTLKTEKSVKTDQLDQLENVARSFMSVLERME